VVSYMRTLNTGAAPATVSSAAGGGDAAGGKSVFEGKGGMAEDFRVVETDNVSAHAYSPSVIEILDKVTEVGGMALDLDEHDAADALIDGVGAQHHRVADDLAGLLQPFHARPDCGA